MNWRLLGTILGVALLSGWVGMKLNAWSQQRAERGRTLPETKAEEEIVWQ